MLSRLPVWVLLAFGGLFAGLGIAALAGGLSRGEFIAAALALAAGLLATLVLLHIAFGPMNSVIAAAKSVAEGDMESRATVGGPRESRAVASAFNETVRRLDELLDAASQERNRLRAALGSSSDAILALGDTGEIVFANAAAAELFERAPEELSGTALGLVLADDEVREGVRASLEEGRSASVMVRLPSRRQLRVTTAPILGEGGGGGWAALVVCHDLTDIAQADEVRRDFVANVSHELRTPIAAIKAVIETLVGGAIDDEAATRDFLARADGEVDRLAQMVEELLELSRLEAGTQPLAREAIDMEAVLTHAVERMGHNARRQGVSLELEVEGALPETLGDAERIERVAESLIHNALKFTESGGSVRVIGSQADGAIAVRVEDTGAGIARSDLPRVFERFYKTDKSRGRSGTGLGLAIAKHTVEAHGGSISVESIEGQGSTFAFTLPVTPAA